jgi:hypothetical protein
MMFLRLVAAVCVLLVCGVALVAAEMKGRIVKVDAPNHKITVSIDEKQQEFTLTDDARILGPKGPLKDGLKHKVFQSQKALQKGIPATLTTEKKNDAEVVTEIKLGSGKKKPQ